MRRIVLIFLLAGSAFAQRAGRPARPAWRPHPYRGGGTVLVPYPAYGGGYYPGYVAPAPYGYGYDQSYGSYPPAGYYDPSYGGYPPAGYYDPSQQPPAVVVNPYYRPDTVNPVLRDYSNTPLPPPGNYSGGPPLPDPDPTIYLIAMKDHTILPAVGYWVENDTLNYVTSEGVRNKVSLALVDRDFSKQLNDERHVEFKLPPAK